MPHRSRAASPIALALSVLTLACIDPFGPHPCGNATNIQADNHTTDLLRLPAGNTVILGATVEGCSLVAQAPVTWTSLDTAVARAYPAGIVYGLQPGETRIAVQVGQCPGYDYCNPVKGYLYDTISLRVLPIQPGGRFSTLTAGGGRTCGVVEEDDQVYCWGAEVMNACDTTGTSNACGSLNPADRTPWLRGATWWKATCGVAEAYWQRPARDNRGVTCSRTPSLVAADERLVQIAFADMSSANVGDLCGLTVDGGLRCGFLRSSGENIPAPPLLVVAGGFNHACGLTAAGEAYCWGNDGWGQLGDGATATPSWPVPVAGGLRFGSIFAGGGHTCAVALDGTGYCFGLNHSGQLGQSGTTLCTNPAQSAAEYCSRTPVAVTGEIRFAGIWAGAAGPGGYGFSCGTDTAGAAWCWGSTANGRLGIGPATFGTQTTPARVSGNLTFRSLALGESHACGLTASGQTFCWGSNEVGQLGSDVEVYSNVPVPVSLELTFTMLVAGLRHTCGLTEEGLAYCWGENRTGALGTGSLDGSNRPVLVAGQGT